MSINFKTKSIFCWNSCQQSKKDIYDFSSLQLSHSLFLSLSLSLPSVYPTSVLVCKCVCCPLPSSGRQVTFVSGYIVIFLAQYVCVVLFSGQKIWICQITETAIKRVCCRNINGIFRMGWIERELLSGCCKNANSSVIFDEYFLSVQNIFYLHLVIFRHMVKIFTA